MIHRSWIAVALLLALAVVPVSSGPKREEKSIVVGANTADALKGLAGVQALVSVDPDAVHDGLRQEEVQTDVELKLRLAGIKVLTADETRKTPGVPFLAVTIGTSKQADGNYVFAIDVSLNETATLERTVSSDDGSKTRVKVKGMTTWHQSTVYGTVAAANLPQLRDTVTDIVNKFCNEFLQANPKR
jgi:hypothetical protein